MRERGKRRRMGEGPQGCEASRRERKKGRMMGEGCEASKRKKADL